MIELFENSRLNARLSWHHAPSQWQEEGNALQINTDPETDFWQRTHYGFSADNGHFLYALMDGDFEMETRVSYRFKNQYDQAGLMVRGDAECWIKTAIEYEPDGRNMLGVVVTNHEYSDWSTQQIDKSATDLSYRIIREGDDFMVFYKRPGNDPWIQLRMTHLHNEKKSVRCGLYACSPKGAGFSAIFHSLSIRSSK